MLEYQIFWKKLLKRRSSNQCHSWWRHQMETFSASMALCAGNSPVNSPHKGQWRGALMFSLISAWMNGWVNNREAGDLRHHRAHYDVLVMLAQSVFLVYHPNKLKHHSVLTFYSMIFNCTNKMWYKRQRRGKRHSLTQKYRNLDEILVTGCTGSCQNYIFMCC